MKKIYIIQLITLLFLSGCTDYLDEIPDNRIEINSLEKASELLVAAYPRADYFFTDWMTDNVEFIVTNKQIARMTDTYLWEDLDEYDDYNTPSNYWNEAYTAIAQANTALESLGKINDDNIDRKNAIQGEALLCRAYAHFMLVSLFGDNYNETTSVTDLGVPYVTETEKVLLKNYKRNTVKEVYDMVEKDLTDGMALLSDDYYSGSKKYHFTKNAANAFACRFYMYKGDYAESIKYANLVLGDNTVNTAFIKDMNEYGNQSGSVAKRNFFVSNTDPSNILIVEKQVGIGLRHSYGYRMGVKQWNKLFDTKIWSGNDLRGDYMGYYGDGDRNVIRAPKMKEEFYKESLTATTGYPFCVQPVFRGIELLFNRVESNIELGNFAIALSDLNTIGQLRYDGAAALTIADIQAYYASLDPDGNIVTPDEKEALMSLLLDEKRKEYLQEGMRWFDIKRHDIEITHITFDGKEVVLAKNDKRKVLQIPLNASSRGIIKNPR